MNRSRPVSQVDMDIPPGSLETTMGGGGVRELHDICNNLGHYSHRDFMKGILSHQVVNQEMLPHL